MPADVFPVVMQVPGRLIVTGRVMMFDDFKHEFNVVIRQRIQNGTQNSHLDVHATMDLNTMPHIQSRLMPRAYGVVSFTGNLMAVAPGIARVAVDSLSYVPPRVRHL